jgi:hypothetical protein
VSTVYAGAVATFYFVLYLYHRGFAFGAEFTRGFIVTDEIAVRVGGTAVKEPSCFGTPAVNVAPTFGASADWLCEGFYVLAFGVTCTAKEFAKATLPY